MWIVKLALVRPYTFVVMSLMLLIAGVGSTIRMPKDIFPAINEPAVTVLWQYPGFPAANMANEIVEWSEFITSQFVGDIKRMESRSIFGYSVMRLYFHPNVNIDRAPILGEAPGLPGFYNCVSSNGYTLAPVLARLHSACFTGDLLGSLKCDCGAQLQAALAQIAAEVLGVDPRRVTVAIRSARKRISRANRSSTSWHRMSAAAMSWPASRSASTRRRPARCATPRAGRMPKPFSRASAVAKKVFGWVMTSSPGPMPSAMSASQMASVPLPRPMAYLVP